MHELINYENHKRFNDNGSSKREKEDLSYHLFEDLDFSKSEKSISFFRSDFRGSRFTGNIFYKNNFSRADFISCVFKDCQFNSVIFKGSEFKNCFFENVSFNGNDYNSAAYYQCTFKDCSFPNAIFKLTSINQCRFESCVWRNCHFKTASTEELYFCNTTISKSNIATMHAENYVFENCKLIDVIIDISYIWGYLIDNHTKEQIRNVKYLYRGKSVALKDIPLNELRLQRRYFEYINANILVENTHEIIELIFNALIDLSKENILQIRKTEITKILDGIYFYIKNNIFNSKQIEMLLLFLKEFDWDCFELLEKLDYFSRVDKITNMSHFSKVTRTNSLYYTLEFHCQTNDFEIAQKACEYFIGCIRNIVGNFKYKLLEVRQGSLILVFGIVLGGLAFVAGFPKIVKSFARIRDIRFERTAERMHAINKITQEKKIAELLSKDNLSSEELKNIITISSALESKSDSIDESKLLDVIQKILLN